MKHAMAYLFAGIFLVTAGAVLWFSRHELTPVRLGFVGGFVALSAALAIPADFKQACEAVAPYVPQIRGRADP